jgi:Tol biopolymer transport system component/DNA-binding winged helix-turn-helix (wHTH) protein
VQPGSQPSSFRFGPYSLDLRAGELHKQGARIRLQEKSLRVLAALAEQQGQVVTREELKKRLWPGDTFVDFETGLNTAVSKLRDALCDNVENPRYIETLPRRGYRFVSPVEIINSNGHLTASLTVSGGTAATNDAISSGVMQPARNEQTIESLASTGRQLDQMRSSSVAWLRGTVVVAALVLLFTIWWLTPLPDPRVTDIFSVTQTGRQDFLVRPATDGIRIFYVQRAGDHYDLMQSSANGGEAQKIDAPFPNSLVWDVSPDGSKYLLTSFRRRGEPGPLWSWPATGGAPVKIGDIVSGSATFSPDGKQIVYHIGHDLLVANADGTGTRKLANLDNDEPDSPVWAPDGRSIRFNRNDPERDTQSIWEIAVDGSNPHPVLPNWQETPKQCCGTWTPDGRYFLFVEIVNPANRLYAIREKGVWWRRSPRGPFLVASEASGAWSPLVSRDGQYIYYYGKSVHSDLEKLDLATGQFSAVLNDSRPRMLSVSLDGQWVSYIQSITGMLWVSHLDGSAAKRIPLSGMEGAFPRLSPDSQRIVLTGIKSGLPHNVYMVSSAGGTPQPVVANATGMSDPDWSPDGARLIVERTVQPSSSQPQSTVLAGVDLKTLQITNVPGSEDLHQPRWSPNGRYLAAVRGAEAELMVFDIASQVWRKLAEGKSMSFPVWSPDSASVYSQDSLSPGQPLYRVEIASGTRSVVVSFEKALSTGVQRCAFVAVLPNGAPLVAFDRNNSDIFGARLVLP